MNGAKNQFVTLNIGVRYQTLKSVLQSIPNTLLGNMFNENNSSIHTARTRRILFRSKWTFV
jgi:hypothetical protein